MTRARLSTSKQELEVSHAKPGPLPADRSNQPLASDVPPLLVSATEPRRLLSVGTTKFYELVETRDLETVLVGHQRYVIYSSILRYVDALSRGDA